MAATAEKTEDERALVDEELKALERSLLGFQQVGVALLQHSDLMVMGASICTPTERARYANVLRSIATALQSMAATHERLASRIVGDVGDVDSPAATPPRNVS